MNKDITSWHDIPLANAKGRAAAHMDDTRSEHVLRERLDIARNATHGPWALWTWDNGQMEIRSHADPDEERVGMVWNKRDGTFLNRNSPLEVMADIEEILTLRAEKHRLEQMVAQLADFLCCYPDARCPVEIDRIDFTCPHGRTWEGVSRLKMSAGAPPQLKRQGGRASPASVKR